MKEEYKEFIGIYDESVPVTMCNQFVEDWGKAKKNRTILDLSKENNTGLVEDPPPLQRKDEVAFVTPITSTIFPMPPVTEYFKYITECFLRYSKNYGIDFQGPLYNDVFKIHRVGKSEGYHAWHYERSDCSTLDRFMVYMTYLEAPKEGGETEFLHQSLRIKPVVGRTLIWPAGYTHMHRGSPPLDGEKMYIDGWITAGRIDASGAPQK